MCFVLYAGADNTLYRRTWKKGDPDLCVESLTERDFPIKAHFCKLKVQYLGSTAGCGCYFPHVTLNNGRWLISENNAIDTEKEDKVQYNRKALVILLQDSGEEWVELYGVWDGDFDEPPKASEIISLKKILDPTFLFKERCFYRVNIESETGSDRSIY